MEDLQRFDSLVAHIARLSAKDGAVAVRQYFATLPETTVNRLIEHRADQVGELKGAPPTVRYAANIERLKRDRAALQNRVDKKLVPWWKWGERRKDKKRLATVKNLLKRTSTLEADEFGNTKKVERHRQFLSVSTKGDGRLVEVLGDLEKAKHVAVAVPGMLVDIDDQADQRVRAGNIKAEAGEDTAVVNWLGYDTPDEVVTASQTGVAEQAAAALTADMAGIDAVRDPDSDISALGHSFGSCVVARAAYNGAPFNRVILCGSPGIAPNVTRAAHLNRPDIEWFTARAPWDYVAYTQWHGADPATWPDATRIATDGVFLHDRYHGPNTAFTRNAGLIIRGEQRLVTRTNTSPSRETRLLVPGVSVAPAIRGIAATLSVAYDGVAKIRGKQPRPPLGVRPRDNRPGDSRPQRRNGPSR